MTTTAAELSVITEGLLPDIKIPNEKLSEKLRKKILQAYEATHIELPPDVSPDDIRANTYWYQSARIESLLTKSPYVASVRFSPYVPFTDVALGFGSKNRPRLEGPYSVRTLTSLLNSARKPVTLEPAIMEDLGDGLVGYLDANTRALYAALGYLPGMPAYIIKIPAGFEQEDHRYMLLSLLNRQLNGTAENEIIVRTRCVQWCINHNLRGDKAIDEACRTFGVPRVDSIRARVDAEYIRSTLRDKVSFDIGSDRKIEKIKLGEPFGEVEDDENVGKETRSTAPGGGLTVGVLHQIDRLVPPELRVQLAEMAFEFDMAISEVKELVDTITLNCGKGSQINKAAAAQILEKETIARATVAEPTRPADSGQKTGKKSKPVKENPLERSFFENTRSKARGLWQTLSNLKNNDIRAAVSQVSQAKELVEWLHALRDPIDLIVARFEQKFGPIQGKIVQTKAKTKKAKAKKKTS